MNTESKKPLDEIQLKREILKRIKKERVFPKFYLACAKAYSEEHSPRTHLNNYLELVVGWYMDHGNMDTLIEGIRTWQKTTPHIIIMP